MPAVVIELDFEPIGANLRFLPGRSLRRTERPAAESKHVSPTYERKAKHGERNGKRQRPAHQKERRSSERDDAATLADNGCKLARICPHQETTSNQEKQKDHTTGKKIPHRGMPFSRAARADGAQRRPLYCR